MARTSKVLVDQGHGIRGDLPWSRSEDRCNPDSRIEVADDHTAGTLRHREQENRLASDRGDVRVLHGR
jgi:hypothetical protein